jgi:2-oxoglutarate dehydrogenase E1 component
MRRAGHTDAGLLDRCFARRATGEYDPACSMNPLPSDSNLAFVESLYAEYLRDPASVGPEWRRFFAGFTEGVGPRDRTRFGPSFRPTSIFSPPGADGGDRSAVNHEAPARARQDRVDQMVRAYRVRGHMLAQLDPLEMPRPVDRELDPAHYGFTADDMNRPFSSRTIHGKSVRTLGEILELLRDTYCRYIGVQFMHIDDLEIRHWLQERMEGTRNRLTLSRREQFRILTRLTDAVIFEQFIQKKYTGAKSFSLEGAETLIPLLDLAIEQAGDRGIEEIVIGMPHRGRLNVLANIVGKSPRLIFREFADVDAEENLGRGDVKYHLGYHGDWTTVGGRSVHLVLCFNPSHLEFVNPVALGRVRAKQDRLGDASHERAMAILIHGDAAFTGEGIIQETLNLSELQGYSTGGTLHVIINNQIGFTTSPQEGCSSLYASAIGKMLQIPIFHVNGEHPESVAQVVRLATDFRKDFRRDVIIDMYCYRRRGHNEGDEPAFTQPLMYRAIRSRPSVRESYLNHLRELGDVTREQADEIAAQLRERLEAELSAAREPVSRPPARPSSLGQLWSNYHGGPDRAVPEVDTGVERERLVKLLESLSTVPDDFQPHRKLKRFLDARRQMALGEQPLDWSTAEALVFATLVTEGTRVRLSGQDSARGTFTQRHAVLHDVENDRTYMPLQHLSKDQAPFEVCNSPLSEAGVLGFEYGYSLGYPDALVMWEAQFGDFANAAQVIIDEFVAGAEDKWHSLSGLVLLLPHGFEGQGPEHSSARLERFLQLAAGDHIQVVYPTTPAQYFHVLRRQVVRPWRKPLIVMTPKSLLRNRECVSGLDELSSGRFQRILRDDSVDPKAARRVLLCAGKIYYELDARRRELETNDLAIIRVEQLYPLADEAVKAALEPYPDGTHVIWAQEEPENMGAWRYMHGRFGSALFGRWPFCGIFRKGSGSPATGSTAAHRLEQSQIVDAACGLGLRDRRAADTCCSGVVGCDQDCWK